MKIKRRDENGTALVMALIMLTILALFLTALLTFSEASFKATLAVRDQRQTTYAAEGAAHMAIQKLRNNPTSLLTSPYCLTNFELNGKNNLHVKCDSTSALPSSAANTPEYAVLTRGNFSYTKNNELNVGGPVFVNGNISSSPGDIVTRFANVFARNGSACPSSIKVDPGYTKNCNAGTTVGNPNFPNSTGFKSSADQYTYRIPKTSCPTTGAERNLMVFDEGFYDNVDLMNAALSLPGNCRATLFKPGFYYFDFTGSTNKTINLNGVVIGGEIFGWNGTSFTEQPDDDRRCKTDQDGPGDGVQWIFGGTSKLHMGNADLELCAARSATEQEIAVYGLTSSGTSTPSSPTFPPTHNSVTPGSPTFINPTNAYVINGGGSPATSDLTITNPSSNTTKTITLDQFATSGAIPGGSVINSVGLRIRHRETGSIGDLQLVVRPGDGSAPQTIGKATGSCGSSTTGLCIASSYSDQTINLLSILGSTSKINGVGFDYQATVNKNQTGTENLDGVQLLVTYTPPTYHAQPLATTLFDAPSNGDDKIMIHGTVYAWNSNFIFRAKNGGAFGIERGIIANNVTVDINPAAGDIYGFQLIGDQPEDFNITVCDEATQDTCTNPKLKAKVSFNFSTYDGPLSILRWLVVR